MEKELFFKKHSIVTFVVTIQDSFQTFELCACFIHSQCEEIDRDILLSAFCFNVISNERLKIFSFLPKHQSDARLSHNLDCSTILTTPNCT